jgi:hypothetical protein
MLHEAAISPEVKGEGSMAKGMAQVRNAFFIASTTALFPGVL